MSLLAFGAFRQSGWGHWILRNLHAIVFVEEVLWLESLPQTKSKKPEISAPQAVCDVVIAAPPKLKARTCYAEIRSTTGPAQCGALRFDLLTVPYRNCP